MSLRITEFYNNKAILVTGCTGFLAKILLEMIMRRTNFRKLYILIRAK